MDQSTGLLILLAVLVPLLLLAAILGATWLRKSALHLRDGVLLNDGEIVALGFEQLRWFFVMFGVFCLRWLVGGMITLFWMR